MATCRDLSVGATYIKYEIQDESIYLLGRDSSIRVYHAVLGRVVRALALSSSPLSLSSIDILKTYWASALDNVPCNFRASSWSNCCRCLVLPRPMVDGSLCSMWRPVSWSLDPQIRLLRFYRIFHGFGSFVSTWWIHLVTRCLTVIKISLNVNETCHNPWFQKAISLTFWSSWPSWSSWSS